jgi:hypothetical protein
MCPTSTVFTKKSPIILCYALRMESVATINVLTSIGFARSRLKSQMSVFVIHHGTDSRLAQAWTIILIVPHLSVSLIEMQRPEDDGPPRVSPLRVEPLSGRA